LEDYLIKLVREEEAREMEGTESKLDTKSVKGRCKYCKCKSHIVRTCEIKSNKSKFVDLTGPIQSFKEAGAVPTIPIWEKDESAN